MSVVVSTLALAHGQIISYRMSRPSSGAEETPPASPSKWAVISHPLARLGGSSRDHVVSAVESVLLEAGWNVVAYDSRGAGASNGSCSFTYALVTVFPGLRSIGLIQTIIGAGRFQKAKTTQRSLSKLSGP